MRHMVYSALAGAALVAGLAAPALAADGSKLQIAWDGAGFGPLDEETRTVLQDELDAVDDELEDGQLAGPLLNRRGVLLARLGRHADARRAFVAASEVGEVAFGGRMRLARGPWQAFALNNLGVLDLFEGRAEQALRHFELAARQRPDDEGIIVNAAIAALVKGDHATYAKLAGRCRAMGSRSAVQFAGAVEVGRERGGEPRIPGSHLSWR